MKGKSLYLCNRFREGEPLRMTALEELRLREIVLIAAPSILPCGCARERERISRTPSENLPKIFSKKTFEKNLEVTKKRLTFANAFPLKRELERKDSSLKDFR